MKSLINHPKNCSCEYCKYLNIGQQQARREELEFLKRLPKEWLEYSYMKERIKRLEKEQDGRI